MGYIDEDNVNFRNGIAYYCAEPCSGYVAFWHKREEGATELKCKRITEYSDGMKHGQEEEFTRYGQTVYVCNYEKNQLHGPYIKYRPDGRVSETVEYVEGEKQEQTLQYYDSMGKAIK